MTTKKDKNDTPKKKKVKDDINDEIDGISDEINILSKSTKLKDILKKYKQIKNNLDNINEKVTILKSSFEGIDSASKKDQKETIDDDTYDKFTKEISEMSEGFDDFTLEEQISKYKLIIKKIIMCDQYLKSKKLEVIECSDIEPSTSTDESND